MRKKWNQMPKDTANKAGRRGPVVLHEWRICSSTGLLPRVLQLIHEPNSGLLQA